ncbi:hypothetical protein ONZ45_g8284 [Pleurotus djamor]|nr:hypothetical protein ONZ45_g8284 [Pleurotus djamor]
MSHYTLRSQSRRPRTSPSNDDSSGGIAKMFSSLKKKAAALVSTSPSPSFPSSPLPPTSSHVRSTKRHSRDRRPHTAPSHRPNTSSSRKHGLANHPRPPAIRPVTPRRDSSASTTSTTSTTSSTSDTSFDSSLSSSSIETPTSSPSPSPIPSSSKARLDRVHSEQISHLQDQISALLNAISPLPHAHIQRVSIIPEETESGNLTLIDSDSESTYSTDSLVPISSEQLHSQAAKRSSVLLALYPSSRPSTSEKKDCDPFAKDTVQVVHAFPGFGTSVTLKIAFASFIWLKCPFISFRS